MKAILRLPNDKIREVELDSASPPKHLLIPYDGGYGLLNPPPFTVNDYGEKVPIFPTYRYKLIGIVNGKAIYKRGSNAKSTRCT
jgi:hypothetical protein